MSSLEDLFDQINRQASRLLTEAEAAAGRIRSESVEVTSGPNQVTAEFGLGGELRDLAVGSRHAQQTAPDVLAREIEDVLRRGQADAESRRAELVEGMRIIGKPVSEIGRMSLQDLGEELSAWLPPPERD